MSSYWLGVLTTPAVVALGLTLLFVIGEIGDFLEEKGFFLIFGRDLPEPEDTKRCYIKVNKHPFWHSGCYYNEDWGSHWFQVAGVCVGFKRYKYRLDRSRPYGVGSLSSTTTIKKDKND